MVHLTILNFLGPLGAEVEVLKVIKLIALLANSTAAGSIVNFTLINRNNRKTLFLIDSQKSVAALQTGISVKVDFTIRQDFYWVFDTYSFFEEKSIVADFALIKCIQFLAVFHLNSSTFIFQSPPLD